MELPEECLTRACYCCPFHKSCLIEKQIEEYLDLDIVKYYKALFKQQHQAEQKK